MFKQITSGFTKFFTKERILVLIIFLVLVWALLSYSGTKTYYKDNMDVGYAAPVILQQPQPLQSAQPSVTTAPVQTAPVTPGYALQPVANPSDLLPKDQNSQWSALNPNTMNQGDVLMPDLLQAGYHIGLDTIGQTLRNANLQLRSDPVISKSDIGPWNQSTIEPDYGRVPLEIGQGNK
jgi:hypothetical protein